METAPVTLTAPTPEATREIARRLSEGLRDGDTVVLMGGLGAGKSEFARGIARGLGYDGPIPSPSFTILNEYEGGRLALHHFDWYRIADSGELYESGLDEYIGGVGVCVIEWSERAPDILPEDRIVVTLTPMDNDVRSIRLEAHGDLRLPDSLVCAADGASCDDEGSAEKKLQE
ncbi:MAG: tRNA (adenosine(37)-N6)-threonylcarbamoyltransferase complex ATPase subunit type 1 TsaE [Clostridia bacterium]|nr:tRNA (adenosine(37)-N6)-threonylcarbamoyltransferase complex ATPase subunit type 1 TsaE [Clostridia bacterium]